MYFYIVSSFFIVKTELILFAKRERHALVSP